VVKVGVVGPFSGEFAVIGSWVQQGSQLAAKEVEQQHGVTIELIYEDSGCSTKEMLTAFNKLHAVDNIEIITGFPCDPDTGASWADENDVIVVNGGDNYGQRSENWYDVRFPLQDAMQTLGEFAYDEGARRTGIIYYDKIRWGQLSKEGYAKGFEKKGGTIIGAEGIGDGVDFRTSLLKFKEKNADSVLMIYSNGADFVNQLAEMNMRVMKLTDSQFESPRSITIGGNNLNETYYVRAVDADISSATNFRLTYEEEFGHIPDLAAIANHDAILIVGNAIKVCNGGEDLECIRSAIRSTKDLPGASGILTFDKERLTFQNPQFMVKTFANGSFVNYEAR
jgi:branched-chain amino acid transport system substrate-binding protein